MQKTHQGMLYSPHDLVAFLEGNFASWMDRLYFEQKSGGLPVGAASALGLEPACIKPDEGDEERDLVMRKGREHEAKLLAEFRENYPDLVEIEQSPKAPQLTLEAMASGRSAIYQGCLASGDLLGYPDFLVRIEGGSRRGGFLYEPWDAKLAKSAKPAFIVQLCAYAEMLEALQGERPRSLTFLLGTGLPEVFKADDFFFYYRRFKKAFVEFQSSFDPSKPPEPGLERSFGRWETVAQDLLKRSDHLSRVAGITRLQIKRLEHAGIRTMMALAKSDSKTVSRMQAEVLARLKQQARLQVASKGLAQPQYLVLKPRPDDPRRGLALLPPESRLDVFFDMEGFPLVEGGLEYLFGAAHLECGEEQYSDWWAQDGDTERKAFEQFVDWAHARWRKDPAMHIYHYAAYERTALGRLMGKYATREQEVDDLLRNEVLMDLYRVVQQGVQVGAPGYSLKDIECLLMLPRQGQVMTASGSVVAFQRWLDRGEPADWRASAILGDIRAYNRTDCSSLRRLRDWLRGLQEKEAIAYLPEAKEEAKQEKELPDSAILANALLQRVSEGRAGAGEERRLTELLAWLLEFHRREAKPVWWRMFDRLEMTEQELIEDLDCLGGLTRTRTPVRQIKRSWEYEYAFDPDQDTKLDKEKQCIFAHDRNVKTTILEFDRQGGRLTIKLGPSTPTPPNRLGLIPYDFVPANKLVDTIYRYVQAWSNGQGPSLAVDDLLNRRRPRIEGHRGGPIIQPGEDITQRTCSVIFGLQGSTLCIQGPPGTGKTYVSGAAIARLLRDGRRVAVTANSHKAILNVMRAVVGHLGKDAAGFRLLKVGGDKDDDPLVSEGIVRRIESGDVDAATGHGPVLVGGTAWAFSREELQQRFDYLFVDEAGQFSLANAVAVGLATRNLVLVGDQMQLSQPTQGSHPGESGMSALEYLLNGHATIPADFGIFLDVTRRLRPEVCRFVSDAVYEGRLKAHEVTARRKILFPKEGGRLGRSSGIVFVPVVHEGNSQCSDEEVEVISGIVDTLLGGEFVEQGGQKQKLGLEHILFVAPFNMQVRQLRHRLGPGARVGSVDMFQGLEAPVVIVSMCSSTIEDSPRGAEFLLNPNRINVAVSRAQCLAIVVGSPGIMSARCQTISEMRLVNLFCRLADYSEELGRGGP